MSEGEILSDKVGAFGRRDAPQGRNPFIGFLLNNDWPPLFFVSVASKGLNVCVSGLESTLACISISVDSKGAYVAPKLCKMGFSFCFL